MTIGKIQWESDFGMKTDISPLTSDSLAWQGSTLCQLGFMDGLLSLPEVECCVSCRKDTGNLICHEDRHLTSDIRFHSVVRTNLVPVASAGLLVVYARCSMLCRLTAGKCQWEHHVGATMEISRLAALLAVISCPTFWQWHTEIVCIFLRCTHVSTLMVASTRAGNIESGVLSVVQKNDWSICVWTVESWQLQADSRVKIEISQLFSASTSYQTDWHRHVWLLGFWFKVSKFRFAENGQRKDFSENLTSALRQTSRLWLQNPQRGKDEPSVSRVGSMFLLSLPGVQPRCSICRILMWG